MLYKYPFNRQIAGTEKEGFIIYYDEFSVEDGGSFYVVEFNLYLKTLGIYQRQL